MNVSLTFFLILLHHDVVTFQGLSFPHFPHSLSLKLGRPGAPRNIPVKSWWRACVCLLPKCTVSCKQQGQWGLCKEPSLSCQHCGSEWQLAPGEMWCLQKTKAFCSGSSEFFIRLHIHSFFPPSPTRETVKWGAACTCVVLASRWACHAPVSQCAFVLVTCSPQVDGGN